MNALASYLQARSLTQTQFARTIGVKQPLVSKLVRGLSQPSPELAVRIARATQGVVPFYSWPAYSPFKPQEVGAADFERGAGC
ncbi:helix-turn-helix domain-containing protein [Rhodovulum kholense]|uniref:helix-turn-helix domain-containing protein n=1 Tax=Rhodovulum kholense TaxID=453584 RepID=UPI000D3560D0